MKEYKGLFVTFEGGEGAGKTTASLLVKKILENNNMPTLVTREPGGTDLKFAEDIRKTIMKYSDIDPMTELLLFESSRREHLIKKVLPNLESGKIVISDRFIDSTVVYQGIAKGIPLEDIQIINEIVIDKNYPDITFIFDVDPEIGLGRIKKNNRGMNKFDKYNFEFHNKIRQGYWNLKDNDKNNRKFILLDASRDINTIAEEISMEIKKSYETKINKKS